MNWDAIGAIGEVLGAITVLITLIYLATQIRQTNEISRFASAKDVMDKFDVLNDRIVEDTNLRQALNKRETLTEDEQELVYAFANMFVNTWVICQSAYENGLVNDGFYRMAKNDVRFELERWPNFRPAIISVLDTYPEFRGYEIFAELSQ